MAEKIIVAHKGIPCTPPVVDGVEFLPLGEDDIYVGECSEEVAAHITRIPEFVRYGGGLPFPADSRGEAGRNRLAAEEQTSPAAEAPDESGKGRGKGDTKK